ncbi:benzoate/H(+) symporter BenE family transporter [Maritalea mediterranea]|uniref:Benzoate/H(+) symporter BenE family transporter n=1 Tax=Maritalea mediterranea TaxID=2909667 RepID=A0ABS9EAL2_9HYPH|nr:benzoate/H(+) symporter BenE family transporter [Maritalea mediterranea]MCF4099927.1 benzoate/H(+) symporter BenE family transporter [Maritalea mediterranea]
MLKQFSPQALFMGLLVAFVGSASSFAVVLQGLRAVGATEDQASTGLMALFIAMGLGGIYLAQKYRMPISVAWSTPGAALLINSGPVEGGFGVAIGAFLISSLLVIMAGYIKPFGHLINKTPHAIANAMLAGILVILCFAPFKAIAFNPALGLPIVLAWLIVGRFNKVLAVPAALIAFIIVVVLAIELPADSGAQLAAAFPPKLAWVTPQFSLPALIGLALPLFFVNMASQNIPGLTVLRVHKYDAPAGDLFSSTGIFSLLAAPFGAHGVTLAAITAAMCASEEAHPDPQKRYWAAIIAGIAYVLLGLIAGVAATFITLAPSILIEAVAGLALIGAFAASAKGAFEAEDHREAAAVTFLISASGVSFFGVAGAFWGLLAGIFIVFANNMMKRYNAKSENK